MPTDQAGHIIANILGSRVDVEWNIFPQNPHFNMGINRSDIEDGVYNLVNGGIDAEIWVIFLYDRRSPHPNRPISFDFVRLAANSDLQIDNLYNPEDPRPEGGE